jgi:recombination protein RecA
VAVRKPKAEPKDMTPAELMKMVNKKFGEGTVALASDEKWKISKIPTGILSIDYLTQGGFPRGRYVEMFGNSAVGKTAVAISLIASAQKLGMNCLFMDSEKSFNPAFAEGLGVNLDILTFHSQKYGNMLMDIVETYLRSEIYDVIVIDSISALLPKSEMEKNMDAGSYGMEQAKLMSAALRRLTAANKDTVIVFINQQRDAVGGSMFGPRSVTSGGRAMSFYAGMRLELVRTESIKRKSKVLDLSKGDDVEKDIVKGHRVVVKVNKNKVGGPAPQSEGTFVFDYDLEDIDPVEDLIWIGRDCGWIQKSGDYWALTGFEDERKNGRPRFKSWLKSNKVAKDTLTGWIESIDFEEEDND